MQIYFHFADEDEASFLRHKRLNGIVFLRTELRDYPEVLEYTGFDSNSTAEIRWDTLICRATDVSEVCFRTVNNQFYVDDLRSPVIEFSRSRYDASRDFLAWGRFWYEHKYWDKDEQGRDVLLEKSPELKKLYESLARWIRSHCKRLPNGNYIGEHAQKLLEAGARLSPP